MAGVVFVFVREDASEAEALAEAFEAAEYSINGSVEHADALTVILWSRRAQRSSAFAAAATRALSSGKAIVVGLDVSPSSSILNNAPLVDLSDWDGEEDAALDPIFEAAHAVLHPTYGAVIELPSRPVYEDAEFVELAPRRRVGFAGFESERTKRVRKAWETPISAGMLPVQERPEPKVGAPAPRRDFRRLHAQDGHPRAYAALVFALVALIGGGALVVNVAPSPQPVARAIAAVNAASETAPVSLTSASAEAVGLEDAAPQEAPPLFEPAPQVGRAGLEPASARSLRRAAYAPERERRAAYRAPQAIPEDIMVELQRAEQPAG